jgi:hypothetical protein
MTQGFHFSKREDYDTAILYQRMGKAQMVRLAGLIKDHVWLMVTG